MASSVKTAKTGWERIKHLRETVLTWAVYYSLKSFSIKTSKCRKQSIDFWYRSIDWFKGVSEQALILLRRNLRIEHYFNALLIHFFPMLSLNIFLIHLKKLQQIYYFLSSEVPMTYASQVVRSLIFHKYLFKCDKTNFFTKAYFLRML